MIKNKFIKLYLLFPIILSILLSLCSGFEDIQDDSYSLFSKNEDDAPPELSIDYVGAGWMNLSKTSNSAQDVNGLSFYSTFGDDLDLRCTAPYPLTWNISGVIHPSEILKLYPPERDLQTGSCILSLALFYGDARNFTELISSAEIICEKVGDSKVSSKVLVFVTGPTGNNKPILQTRGKSETVKDSNVIPCFTTDPTSVPKLFQTQNGNEVLVQDVSYNPTEGFLSKTQFRGEFVCRRGFEAKRITATVTLNQDGEYQFTPGTPLIKKFTEDSIILKCSSKSKPIRLTVIENPNVTVTFLRDTPIYKEVRLSVDENNLEGGSGSSTVISGRAACIRGSGRGDEVLNVWNYEFYATPELYLDNFEGEVDCITEFTPRIIQTVRCKNPADCRFMKRCFRNVTDCNFKKQKQFYGNAETTCYIERLGHGRACASVPYSHLNGIAQCTVANGLTKTWEYFISLDFLKYSNWKDAPSRELVRMDEMSSILYTNKSTEFVCIAVSYLFANSLAFEMEVQNGSKFILEHNDVTVNITRPLSDNPRKIDEFNIIAVLSIDLPLDAVGMHCHAPIGNNSEVFITSRVFETRHLLEPKLDEKEEKMSSKTFYIGEVNRRFSCNVKGEPQPNYIWLFKRNSTGNFAFYPDDLQTSLGSKGEGYLEFPEVKEQHSGEYKCVASNSEGEVVKLFKLKVEDEPVSKTKVVYVTTVLIVLTLLVLVLAVMFIFMRRYKAAKELVRSLTDKEIEEFFEGKPELLSNSGGINQQHPIEAIEFLPYKNEYEISLDDIEFDQSTSNFLGSGEFSYVVKGRIISKQRPVAVKISKPTADVTLFKSLLSEVKIMIYIGEHDNIVRLIGVCTQSIRNRSIHIATEICELGSLETYLRKARPMFINLIDANQRIDRALLPEEEGSSEVSTIDLISFSAQIAKGMEYLTFKNVVHADLAARNVLLTSNKVCRISDFGLSKKLYECNNYVKKSKSPLPWRWMPPEALNTLTFSSQSDVWSYGATLYEIFTLGDIPYPNEEWNKEFLTRLASGMRMGRPKYSTPDIYSKIMTCWETEPELRTQFLPLRIFFEGMLEELGVIINKDLNVEDRYATIPKSSRTDRLGSILIKQESLYTEVSEIPEGTVTVAPAPVKVIPPKKNPRSFYGKKSSPPSESPQSPPPSDPTQYQNYPQPNYANIIAEEEMAEVPTAAERTERVINADYVNTME